MFPVTRNCTDGNYGWKCNDGSCIESDWVCDGNQQCPYPDNSDEEIGCNLYSGTKTSFYPLQHYPIKFKFSNRSFALFAINNFFIETGCKSWYGKRFIRGQPDNICHEEGVEPSTDCRTPEGYAGWRCNDGFCIEKSRLCDSQKDCPDESDEKEGCQLFPNSTCFLGTVCFTRSVQ